MFVISPWSKGGWVNSQVFDHTSVIRFLEQRFGVMEPNISAWRRAVCGDLTSAFDFAHPDRGRPAPLPDASRSQAIVSVQGQLPVPAPPTRPGPLFQEPGTRPSRALPYAMQVSDTFDNGALILDFANTGTVGVVFHVYDKLHLERIPRRYTVEAGKTLGDSWPIAEDGGRYHLWIYGPNGFVRELRGSGAGPGQPNEPVTRLHYDSDEDCIALDIVNPDAGACTVTIEANHYHDGGPWMLALPPGTRATRRFSIAGSGNWYDFSVRADIGPGYERRFAGRMENGANSISDPAMAVADQETDRRIGAGKDYFY
jgi:phospholipase C